MPSAVSPSLTTMVAGPKTAVSSRRQSAPSVDTHTGVLDEAAVGPVAIGAPTATNPPRQRTTDRTCASGSSVTSLRQLMPVQAVAGSGATANLKSSRLAGDGRGGTVGMAADGMVVAGPGDAVAADKVPVVVALAIALVVGSRAQPATSAASRTVARPERLSSIRGLAVERPVEWGAAGVLMQSAVGGLMQSACPYTPDAPTARSVTDIRRGRPAMPVTWMRLLAEPTDRRCEPPDVQEAHEQAPADRPHRPERDVTTAT